MNSAYLVLLCIVALVNSSLQLLLKKAAPAASAILAGNGNIAFKIYKLFTYPYILLAILALAGGMALWFKVLAKNELSLSYPLNVALTIIITSLASIALFQEALTINKAIGIIVIIAGIFIVLK